MALHRLLPSFLVIIAASTVYSQTFQYSRGWTNGKRSEGQKATDRLEGILERIVDNPCLLGKLKYILEGKPVTEKIFIPCDFSSEEDLTMETHPKRPTYVKSQRSSQDPLYDNFL